MIQHYVTGADDTSLSLLANIYGVSATSIRTATFGSVGVSDWLAEHNGTQQGSDPSHYTGHYWSFSPGMVVNVPYSGSTKSPIQSGAVPGGPLVVLSMSPDGNITVVPEDSSHDETTVPPLVTPSKASAGGGWGSILMWGLGLGLVGMLLFGDEPKKGRKGKKARTRTRRPRRTTRRTRRR